jgi:hypothetical protein
MISTTVILNESPIVIVSTIDKLVCVHAYPTSHSTAKKCLYNSKETREEPV